MVLCLVVIAYLPVTRASGNQKFWQGLRLLLVNRQWVMFLLIVFLGGMTLSIISNFLFLYLNDMNASETLMGLTLAVATISEFPVLFYSDQLLRRWRASGLLVFALLIMMVRCLAYSFVNTPGMVLLIQLMHGMSFSAMWVAGVSYANEIAPKGTGATAQGIFSGVQFGLAGVVAGLVGGFLYENIGAELMYRWVGIFGLIVAIPLFFMRYRLDRGSTYL